MRQNINVKSINSTSTDWYQWGLNCQILKFDQNSVDKILDDGSKFYNGNTEDEDLFWEGYYSTQ